MSYFELAAEQLEFDLVYNPDNNPWTDLRRVALLHELLPKCSASIVAKKINQETGSRFTKNAIIGKATREGLTGYAAKAIRKPTREKKPPRVRKPRMVLKLFSLTVSEPFNDDAKPLNMQPMSYFDDWPNDRCRYPVGSPKSADFYFCGADDGVDVIGGRSFCRFHAKLCYTPTRSAA